MAGQDPDGEGSPGAGQADAEGEAVGVLPAPDALNDPALTIPSQSPLFHAEHAQRYARQRTIQQYQELTGARLVVVIDVIMPNSIVLLEELLYDADSAVPLHILLDSPGGDGETAVRMVRSAQARTTELTVIVPDQAKSAATILAMGAHKIMMGPTSDLGPVDPQFPVGDTRNLVAGKDIIAAVDAAEAAIANDPNVYPLHASLLSQVDALLVQQARSAMDRTDDLVAEALSSNPVRTPEQVADLQAALKNPLIDLPKDHGAIFGAKDAAKHGLPVIEADPNSDQWKLIWRIYATYCMSMDRCRIYENDHASRVIPYPPE